MLVQSKSILIPYCFLGVIKKFLKRNFTIDRFANGLIRIDRKFQQKEMLVKNGIRGIALSKLQSDFFKCHPDSGLGYSIEKVEDGYNITKTGNCGAENKPAAYPELPESVLHDHCYSKAMTVYILRKNMYPCNHNKCLVLCPSCPLTRLCCHIYTCSCPMYAYR